MNDWKEKNSLSKPLGTNYDPVELQFFKIHRIVYDEKKII